MGWALLAEAMTFYTLIAEKVFSTLKLFKYTIWPLKMLDFYVEDSGSFRIMTTK